MYVALCGTALHLNSFDHSHAQSSMRLLCSIGLLLIIEYEFKSLTRIQNIILGVAAIKFLNPSSDSPSSAQFVTGTGYKHVRLYDIKAGQQPSFSIDTGGEYRVTSIQPTSDGNALFVADCSGMFGS
jgi:WD40 repeat protein